MTRLVFIGERRSPSARRMGVRWEDGRLAAKQLFDALRECGIEPGACKFINLFERRGLERTRAEALFGGTVIAMGRKVQAELAHRDVPYIALTHPAARGAVRRKDRYTNEVRLVLMLAGAI
jgi:hypothetical protein